MISFKLVAPRHRFFDIYKPCTKHVYFCLLTVSQEEVLQLREQQTEVSGELLATRHRLLDSLDANHVHTRSLCCHIMVHIGVVTAFIAFLCCPFVPMGFMRILDGANVLEWGNDLRI